MAEVDDNVPEGVFWNSHDALFQDGNKKSKGSKFFDEWKDRRGEFPQTLAELRMVSAKEEPAPAKAGMTPPTPRRRLGDLTPSLQLPPLPPRPPDTQDMVLLALARKVAYDAYVQAGFTRDEALELCTK